MVELSELCAMIVDCEHKTAPKADEGYPLIRTTDIGRGRLDLSNVQRVDADTYEEWTQRAIPQPGDLILAREAPVGNVAKVGAGLEPVLGQRTVLLRPDLDQVDPDYLTYRLLAHDLQYWMNGVANGATVPHLNMEDIRALPLPALPPLDEQRAIGGALAAFDDLIENNRRRIEILEEMARLIYREWFVYFRFPGYEDVELTDSPLGLIPDGWAITAVSDVAELVRGRSYKSADLVEDSQGVPFLNLKCIDRDGGFRKSGLKRYDGPFKPEQMAQAGDTVIAVTDMTQERRIVARAARVPNLGDELGVISLDLVRVVPREGRIDADYLYGMFRYSAFSNEVKEYANGANVLHLSPERIDDYRFVSAPPETQHAFRAVVRPMYDLVENLQVQIETLTAARDLLLPRLISGELDVSDLNLDLEAVG